MRGTRNSLTETPAMAPYVPSNQQRTLDGEPSARGRAQRQTHNINNSNSPRRQGNRIKVVRSPPRHPQQHYQRHEPQAATNYDYRSPQSPPAPAERPIPTVRRPPEAPPLSPPRHHQETTTYQHQQQQQAQNNHYHQSPQPVPPPARQSPALPVPPSSTCSPLNLEFMWKLSVKRQLSTAEINDRIRILEQQGFPIGLAKCVTQWIRDCPIRLWLINNAGTMLESDGHLVVQSKQPPYQIELVDCTRWEEVSSTVQWHAEMAAWCQTPTAIRLSNMPAREEGPQQLGVAASKHLSSSEEVIRLQNLMRHSRPVGGSRNLPLHLQEFVSAIVNFAPKLVQHNKFLTLVLCTDSIFTDKNNGNNNHPYSDQNGNNNHDLVNLLQVLQGLPVSVVVRYASDDVKVTKFYQTLDCDVSQARHQQRRRHRSEEEEAEWTLDVLDDYVGEAERIQTLNPFLYYGYPLHLAREQGMSASYPQLWDSLNERTLSISEMAQLVSMLFDRPYYSSSEPGYNHHHHRHGYGSPLGGAPMFSIQENGHSTSSAMAGLRSRNNNNINLNSRSDALPNPKTQYKAFRAEVEQLNKESQLLWNPIQKKLVPWINLKKLDELYSPAAIGKKSKHQPQQRYSGSSSRGGERIAPRSTGSGKSKFKCVIL